MTLIKSRLVDNLAEKQAHIPHKDVDMAVKVILDEISDALSRGKRVEIRGFGAFSLHHIPAHKGRNPSTGESVHVPAKDTPHFKPGKEMRERVNKGEANNG